MVCAPSVQITGSNTISPQGEVVINPSAAYFNNGDYVTIWTEKTSSGPRLELQLFKSDNTKIACTSTSNTCSGEVVYPFSLTDPWLRIGSTAVGVYDDYTFLIAWSTLTRTGANWQITVQSYKYTQETVVTTETSDGQTSSTTTPASYQRIGGQITITSSSHNNGRFGFTTLSLDPGFVLATMSDQKTIALHRYVRKEKNPEDTSNPNPSFKCRSTTQGRQDVIFGSSTYLRCIDTIQIASSYLTELIILAVPTQYFFSLIWSPLAKGMGIYLQNYNSDTGEKLTLTQEALPLMMLCKPGLTTTQCSNELTNLNDLNRANPKEIKADMSYGGIITIGWHEASEDCSKQYLFDYYVRMFNATQEITAIAIKVSDGGLQLQRVTTLSGTTVMTLLSRADNTYIIMVFDYNGNQLNAQRVPIGEISGATARIHRFRVLSPPSDSSLCWREGIRFVFGYVHAHEMSFTTFRESFDVVVTLLAEYNLFETYNVKLQLYTIPKGSSSTVTDARSIFLKQKIMPIYRRWYLSDNEYALPEQLYDYRWDVDVMPNNVDLTTCNNAYEDYYQYQESLPLPMTKTMFCSRYRSTISLPTSSKAYHTKIAIIAKAKADEISLTRKAHQRYRDNHHPSDCALDTGADTRYLYGTCFGYFMESLFAVTDCVPASNLPLVGICNSSYVRMSKDGPTILKAAVDLAILSIAEFLRSKARPETYTGLSDTLKATFNMYIAADERIREQTWQTIKNMLTDVLTKLTSHGLEFIYGPDADFCIKEPTFAFVSGPPQALQLTPGVGIAIYMCEKITTLPSILPSAFSNPTPTRASNDAVSLVHALFHEITHTVGSNDYLDQVQYYYEKDGKSSLGCDRWATLTNSRDAPTTIIADCITILFIDAFYNGGWI